MAEPNPPQLTKEALSRLASEQAALALTPAEAERMLPLVNDLQRQAHVVVRSNRAGVEPATRFALEDWTLD